MTTEVILGAWVAAGLTLFIFTFLYKDNPLFKLAEHLYVGISVGYTIVKGYELVIRLVYDPIVNEGEWSRLIPVAVGLLMLTRYIPKIAWLSRIAFAFVVGVGSGLAIPRLISSFVLKQVEDTLRPVILLPLGDIPMFLGSGETLKAFGILLALLIVLATVYALVRVNRPLPVSRPLLQISAVVVLVLAVLGYRLWVPVIVGAVQTMGQLVDLNAVIVLLGVVSVLFYFFFSVEHTGAGKLIAQTGIIFLMLSFGAAFGYTAMARMSLLIGRFTDLIEFSRPEYYRATFWLIAATIGILVAAAWRTAKAPPQQQE